MSRRERPDDRKKKREKRTRKKNGWLTGSCFACGTAIAILPRPLSVLHQSGQEKRSVCCVCSSHCYLPNAVTCTRKRSWVARPRASLKGGPLAARWMRQQSWRFGRLSAKSERSIKRPHHHPAVSLTVSSGLSVPPFNCGGGFLSSVTKKLRFFTFFLCIHDLNQNVSTGTSMLIHILFKCSMK